MVALCEATPMLKPLSARELQPPFFALCSPILIIRILFLYYLLAAFSTFLFQRPLSFIRFCASVEGIFLEGRAFLLTRLMNMIL